MKVGDRVKCNCPDYGSAHGQTGVITKILGRGEWEVDLEDASMDDETRCGWPMLTNELTVVPEITPIPDVDHADYLTIAKEVAALVKEKQQQYGDSFGRAGAVLRVLFPDGIKPERYDEVLTLARVLDKLFRIAQDNDPTGESPWKDIMGYSLLSVSRGRK